MGRDVTNEAKSRMLLREVALGFSATSADDFFQQLVLHLVTASGLDHAFVGEYMENQHSESDFIRTIAACVDGKPGRNIGMHRQSYVGLLIRADLSTHRVSALWNSLRKCH